MEQQQQMKWPAVSTVAANVTRDYVNYWTLIQSNRDTVINSTPKQRPATILPESRRRVPRNDGVSSTAGLIVFVLLKCIQESFRLKSKFGEQRLSFQVCSFATSSVISL